MNSHRHMKMRASCLQSARCHIAFHVGWDFYRNRHPWWFLHILLSFQQSILPLTWGTKRVPPDVFRMRALLATCLKTCCRRKMIKHTKPKLETKSHEYGSSKIQEMKGFLRIHLSTFYLFFKISNHVDNRLWEDHLSFFIIFSICCLIYI